MTMSNLQGFKQRLILSSIIAVAPLMITTNVNAQSSIIRFEEVVVTAQKRSQPLQDIPSAVSAISNDSVNDYLGGGENIRALAGRVPGLQIESSNGRQSPRFYIRGLGNYDFDVNATQPVSLIVDEVALENSVLKSVPLFDIERIEVLKGPQGTLFGRSTTAGVVKVDTVKPALESEGYTRVSFGSRNTVSAEFAAGGKLVDTVSSRLSVKYLQRDKWIDNTVNGSGDDFGAFEEIAYRLQFLFSPGDAFSALFKFHGFDQDGDHPQIFYANAFTPGQEGLRAGFDESVASQDGQSGFELEHSGGSVTLRYDFSNMTFTSISAYDTVKSLSRTDIDGGVEGRFEDIGVIGKHYSPRPVTPSASGDGLSDHYQVSQELRLSGNSEDFFYQVGLYYFEEEITVDSFDYSTPIGDVISHNQVDQKTTSSAVFAQIEYALTNALSLTSGTRFTIDDKELEVIPRTGSSRSAALIEASDEYVSWELALRYDVNDDWSVYTRAATASRGPVTLGRFGFTSQADTETILSGEVGVKARLFDNRVVWNTAVYRYDINDQQLTATGGSGNTNELLNAEKTEGYGFETDFEALFTEHLIARFNVSYSKTEIVDPDLKVELCSSAPMCTPEDPIVETFEGAFGTVNLVSVHGNSLPRSPEWTYNISLDYRYPVGAGEIYLSTDWNYRDNSNIFLYESVEFVAQERWIGGVRAGFKLVGNSLDVALVGRNITNEIVADGAIDFLNMTGFVNEPRYWGIEARHQF